MIVSVYCCGLYILENSYISIAKIMFVPPRRQALVYPTTSHVRPNIAGTQFKIAVPDANWYKTWPKSSSSLLGSLLLITSAAIIGLDIANLAIEGKKDDSYLLKGLGLGVAKVGAGLWAGCSTFLAGILVLVIGMCILFVDFNIFHSAFIFSLCK